MGANDWDTAQRERECELRQQAIIIASDIAGDDDVPQGHDKLSKRHARRCGHMGAVGRERRYDRIYHVGLALLMVIASLAFAYLAATTSLWLDEMFQVDYCRTTTLPQIVSIDPYTPPLFNIVAWCWYQVVPYGEVWLRIPSIAFIVGSLPLIAATGRRLGGRRTGFIAAFLTVINAKVVSQMVLTFRTYALLYLLSTLVIYLYVRRVQTPPDKVSWKLSIGTGFAILALGYTHYFGVLLACALFVVDMVMFARGHFKGARAKIAVSYIIPVVGYLPWVRIALQALATARTAIAEGTTVEQWQGLDGINMHALLYWLCGECAEMLGLFHVAVIVVAVVGIYHLYRRAFDVRTELPLTALVFAVFAITGGMWVYNSFIDDSAMFWVERYFTPLVPAMMLVSAWGVAKIFSWIPTNAPVRFVASFLCVLLLVPTAIGTVNNDLSEGSSTRFYADLTEWLEQRDDISDDDTLVLAIISTTDRSRQVDAWKHYYFDRKDTRDFDVEIWEGLDPSLQLDPYALLDYSTVYVTCQHFDPDIPEAYEEVLSAYYTKHETDNPGGGETVYYTKK